MPVLNQALQATVRSRVEVKGTDGSIQVLDQLESRGDQPGSTVPIHAQSLIPYEEIFGLRRTLCAFYEAWEFQAASIYLATLPPSLTKLPTLAPHRELMDWMEGLLNHTHESKMALPAILQSSGLAMDTIRHPVTRLQQRIFHGLHQRNFLDVFIALLTLRDIVAHRVLNDIVPGLVGENGMIDPGIYGSIGCTINPGEPPSTRTGSIKAIQRALKNESHKKAKATWLLRFYPGFDPIRDIRNTVVHRGKLSESDIQILLLWLIDNRPAEASTLEQSLPIFQGWTEAANQVQLREHFPSSGNLWPTIVQSAKAVVWHIHFPMHGSSKI